MIAPTSLSEARRAQLAARAGLADAKAKREASRPIIGSIERMLEENHFSVRLARALGLEDDRR